METIKILYDYIKNNNLLDTIYLEILEKILSTDITFPLILNDIVIFVFINENYNNSIKITGDFNQWNTNIDMDNIPNTNIFFKILKFSSESRLDYRFIIDDQWILDPNNKLLSHGGFGYNSEVRMPKFQENTYIYYAHHNKHGIITYFTIESKILNKEYKIKVYTPYGYVNHKSFPILFFQDGFEYLDYAKVNNQLDNLFNDNKIVQTIAVFIKPNDRNNEYAFNERNLFTKFFSEELLPIIEKNYNPNNNSEYYLFAADFGANISFLIANQSTKFNKLYLQSPQIWPNDFEVLKKLEEMSERIYLNINYGHYEASKDGNYEKLLTKLKLLNIKHDVNLYQQGHGWGFWKSILDKMLIKALDKSTVVNPSECKMNAKYDSDTKNLEISLYLNNHYPNLAINLYNLAGNLIFPIFNSDKDAGNHTLSIKLEDLPSATYIVSMKIANKTFIQKISV